MAVDADLKLYLETMETFDDAWNELLIVVDRTGDDFELYDASGIESVDGAFSEERLMTRVHPDIYWLASTALLIMDFEGRIAFRASFTQ